MKQSLSTAILAITATLALASGAWAAPKASEAVRITQERLAGLGYYAGPTDGVVGEQTANALRDFQARNGLPVSGKVTEDTSYLLRQANVVAANGYYYGNPAYNGYYTNGYVYNGVVASGPAAWVPQGRPLWLQHVPNRFATVAVNEDRRNGVSNYSVTVNGQPVLLASNQPAPIRVSNTYSMSGEDAVIFTSMDGTGGCSYRNYLVTVRSDGTYNSPREIGNCSGGYQASVSNDQLVISFPNGQYATSSTMWDTWRYGAGAPLARI